MRSVWNGMSATLVVAFIGWLVFAQMAPASWWLDVRSVTVADTSANATPTLVVDRSIHQDFAGTYTVDVERRGPRGRYSVVCSARNSTNYRTDAGFPDPLTLDWWTWPVQCQIGPGTYRVETRWRIEPDLFPDKIVQVMSNTFTVGP